MISDIARSRLEWRPWSVWPSGEGPFPVALVLHGIAPTCIAVEEAEALGAPTVAWTPCTSSTSPYLRKAFSTTAIVESLARNGVIAIAPDVTAAWAWWGGEVNPLDVLAALSDVHLDVLASIASGEVALDGLDRTFALDRGRFGLVAHSASGEFAHALISDPTGLADPFDIPDASVLIGSVDGSETRTGMCRCSTSVPSATQTPVPTPAGISRNARWHRARAWSSTPWSGGRRTGR
ncbi:MAG: hypothetical protein R2695_19095 [Acidimicrobiales bacterium]